MRQLVVLLKMQLNSSKKIFFAFLDDLGNFKHFEPYLFFLQKLVQLLNRYCRSSSKKKIVALLKVPLIDILLNVRLIGTHT